MNSNDTFRFAADDATVGHVFSHSQQQQQQGESDGRRIPDNHHQHQDSVIHSHQPAVEESEGGGNVWNRIRAESNGSSSTTRRSYWPVLPQHDEGITVRGSSTNEWFLSSRGEDPPSAISYQSPVSMMMQPSDDLPPSLADSTTFCPTYVWTRISTPSAHPHPSNSSNNNNTMAHPPPRARSGAARYDDGCTRRFLWCPGDWFECSYSLIVVSFFFINVLLQFLVAIAPRNTTVLWWAIVCTCWVAMEVVRVDWKIFGALTLVDKPGIRSRFVPRCNRAVGKTMAWSWPIQSLNPFSCLEDTMANLG